MPDFENIDQYETVNPRSGKPRIVPIAPHSMQAVDYRPRQRKEVPKSLPKPESEFKSVEIEPVSIKQMEKEFRQAARAEARRRPDRGFSGWLKRLRTFLLSLVKPAKKRARKGPPQKAPSRHAGPDRGRKGRGNNSRDTKGDGSSQGNQGQRRGRRRRGPRSGGGPRPDNRKPDPRDGSTQSKADAPRKSPDNRNRPEGSSRGADQAPSSRKPRSSRSRRNRRSSGNAPGRQDSRGSRDGGSGNPSRKSE